MDISQLPSQQYQKHQTQMTLQFLTGEMISQYERERERKQLTRIESNKLKNSVKERESGAHSPPKGMLSYQNNTHHPSLTPTQP